MSQLSQAQPDFLNSKWIDARISPADDFFMHANANWIKTNPIPNEYSRWSIFDKLKQTVTLQLQDIIVHLPQSADYKNLINQQIYAFYASGMNTENIEKLKTQPLMPLINEIKTYHNINNLPALLAKLHSYDVDAFFYFSSDSDLHKPQQMIGVIVQSGINLPHRDYYLKNNTAAKKIQNDYISFLQTIFQQLGLNAAEAQKAALQSFAIEKHLATLFKPSDYFRIPKNIDNQSSEINLAKSYPKLHLMAYFQHRNLPEGFIVNNYTPDYLTALEKYLASLDAKQIQNYLIAQLIYHYANNLNAAFSDALCKFNMQLSGKKSCHSRSEKIIKELNTYLGYAVGDLYVAKYYHSGNIEATNQIVSSIKKQMQVYLTNSTWLSATTKHKALVKLKKMQARVGFNTFKIDYSSLEVKRQSYLENMLAITKFETQRMLNKIGHPVNRHEWDMSPQSVNAYYDISQNRINIPLGILQPPFFDPNANNAVNYGGIGTVIAHEISHAFDDKGAQFNEVGQFHQWWSASDWSIYEQKVNCIINQFSSYPVQGSKNHFLNGKLVSGEAIADLIGVNIAYNAYLSNAERINDKVIGNYSPNQQYFISFAHLWASHMNNEEAIKRARTDPHPPMNLRVNGTLQNIKGFHEAFKVNKHPRCEFF